MGKLTICIDFDGVIHDYRKGWCLGEIYGDVVPGFFEWAERAAQDFRLVVYSSRSATPEGVDDMKAWLEAQLRRWHDAGPYWVDSGLGLHWRLRPDVFEFSATKPPALVTIDDRGIQFRGDWSAPELSVEAIRAFKPWNAGG